MLRGCHKRYSRPALLFMKCVTSGVRAIHRSRAFDFMHKRRAWASLSQNSSTVIAPEPSREVAVAAPQPPVPFQLLQIPLDQLADVPRPSKFESFSEPRVKDAGAHQRAQAT
jgi:hypothetical protein